MIISFGELWIGWKKEEPISMSFGRSKGKREKPINTSSNRSKYVFWQIEVEERRQLTCLLEDRRRRKEAIKMSFGRSKKKKEEAINMSFGRSKKKKEEAINMSFGRSKKKKEEAINMSFGRSKEDSLLLAADELNGRNKEHR